MLAQRCRAAVLIGQTADKIAYAIEQAGPSAVIVRKAKDMQEAVRFCSELAQNGDVVLMSPACASYDMFTNYQQRGCAFREAITACHPERL